MSLWGPVINPYQAGGGGLVTGPGATVTNVLDSTNATDISLALSHTVDAGSDCLVVIARSCVRASVSPVATISSITFGSENLTQRATQVNPDISGDEEVRIEIWTLEGPTSGSDTLTVNYSGSTESASWTALNYSGVHQTTPVGATDGANDTSGSDHSYSGTSTVANSMWVCGDIQQTNSSAQDGPYTPAGSVVEDADGSTGSTNGRDHGAWAGHLAAPTVTSYTLGATATATNNNWAAVAAELVPA